MSSKKPKKTEAKKAKPRRSLTVRRQLKGAPRSQYLLLDSKGEPFDIHESRKDAWYDAVGPRFHRGFYIAEYVLRGIRRYTYKAPPPKEMTDVDD